MPIFMFDTNIIIDICTKCFANSEMHEFVIESTSKRKLNFIRFARPNFVHRFAKKFQFSKQYESLLGFATGILEMSFNVPVKEIANFIFLTSILYQDSFWVAKQDIFFFKAKDESSLELSMQFVHTLCALTHTVFSFDNLHFTLCAIIACNNMDSHHL